MTNIKAKDIELTEKLRSHIEEKLALAGKFIKEGAMERVYVEVGKSTNHHKQGEIYQATLDLYINGEHFHSTSDSEDIYASVDDATSEIVRQIKENKDHEISLFRRGARSVKKMLKGISKRNPFTSKVD